MRKFKQKQLLFQLKMTDVCLEKTIENLSVEDFGEWLRKEKFSENVVEVFNGELAK